MAMLLTEIREQPEKIGRLFEGFSDYKKEIRLENKKVFLFGTGASLSACMQAKYAFLKYAGIAAAVVPAYESLYYMPVLDENCLVMVVSQSGESYETKVICEQLLERRVPFIAITNNPESFLGKNADICLPIMAGEELGTATKTQTGSVMLLYLLAACGKKAVYRQLADLPAAMQGTIVMAEKYKSSMVEFIGGRERLYITGLDAQAPTALQASLMLKEKVWLHAEGLSLAEFRHGPVEVLEKGVPVILIGHGEEKIKTLLGHAGFLSNVCHADVALVTNREAGEIGGYRNFPYIWEGDEELSHICATLPFQLLAETMAEKKGYDIDGFRYIGKILNQYEKPVNGS